MRDLQYIELWIRHLKMLYTVLLYFRKHNGLSNEVEEVPINVSFSVRGCGLVWNIESMSLTSVIYQVYSQDSLEAWHDEGQSVQNWINLSPATLERTKAIKLTIIGYDAKEGVAGKIVVGNT